MNNSVLSIAVLNGEGYFAGSDATHGIELWKTDGTASGTMLVDDIAPGASSSNPMNLAVVGSTLYFAAVGPGGYQQLWKTDGTAAGTVQVSNLSPAAHSGVFIGSILPFGNRVLFQNVSDLYVSDGTTQGTIELATGSQPNGGSSALIFPSSLVVSGQYAYFNQNSSAGYELSRTDGTTAGTFQVDNINSNAVGAYPSGSSVPSAFIAGPPGVAMFFATDGSSGDEPYLVVPDTIIPAGSVVTLSSSASSPQVLVTSVLSIAGTTDGWTGKLDVTNNDADIISGSLATVTNQVKTGYAHGGWQAEGITSTTAAADSTHLTGLGVIQNNQGGSPIYTSSNLLDGTTPGPSDILVKYTYYGDTNLDGKVDGSDYSRIDSGYLTHTTGWYNGDFNYDGVINGSDYTLIDNAFNRQGASLAEQLAAASGVSKVVSSAAMPAGNVSASQSVFSAGSSYEPRSLVDQLFAGDADELRKRVRFSQTAVGL